MRVGVIGDIAGRPGRWMIKRHLKSLKETHKIDFIVANTENATHGSGILPKHASELFNAGIDVMTGGNHTWAKKEIIPLLDIEPILRPLNYPKGVPGKGSLIAEVCGERVAVINLMGYFTMPPVNNPFVDIKEEVGMLKKEGIKNIIIDFHAEATSEKRALMEMLKGEVSAIFGTHTHIGTDDLLIDRGTLYITDVGLTGCRDNVIGVESEPIIKRFLTGLPSKFEVPEKCKRIFQMVVFELEDGKAKDGYKIKAYDEKEGEITQRAFVEE